MRKIIFILTLLLSVHRCVIFSFSLELQNTQVTIEKQRENIQNTRQRQQEDVFESIAVYYNELNNDINIDSNLIAVA